ncbi:MAG: hypothetical protein KG003_10560 [Bacteroidetes bacterium]|nr:hypothetical protein [Bacteroidota bacterium]
MKYALVFIFFFCHFATAQTPEKKVSHSIIMKTGAGYNLGIVDLGKRFPAYSTLPAELYYTNDNYSFGISYNHFLGNRVKVDSLYGGIVGDSRLMFDREGFPGIIRYYMRGFTLQFTAGKLYPIKPEWKHSRIEVRLGAGIMQHKITAKFDRGKLPQIEGEYAKGYDKLSNGPLFTQAVNFHYLNTETVSFFAGINFGQAFTKNRRSWDYGLMRQDVTLRKDFFIGASAGVLIPIVLKDNKSPDYFN